MWPRVIIDTINSLGTARGPKNQFITVKPREGLIKDKPTITLDLIRLEKSPTGQHPGRSGYKDP